MGHLPLSLSQSRALPQDEWGLVFDLGRAAAHTLRSVGRSGRAGGTADMGPQAMASSVPGALLLGARLTMDCSSSIRPHPPSLVGVRSSQSRPRENPTSPRAQQPALLPQLNMTRTTVTSQRLRPYPDILPNRVGGSRLAPHALVG
jgi:hypothetical protein